MMGVVRETLSPILQTTKSVILSGAKDPSASLRAGLHFNRARELHVQVPRAEKRPSE